MSRKTTIALALGSTVFLALSACTDDKGINTVGGAVVGGAIGNQIGAGSGRTAATVAGAVIGGAVAAEATDRRQN